MSEFIVGLTVAQLRELIAESVAEVLADGSPSHQPSEVLTRREAAEFLKTSVATLDRLVREGSLPSHRLGDSPRFVRAELLAYLRGNS